MSRAGGRGKKGDPGAEDAPEPARMLARSHRPTSAGAPVRGPVRIGGGPLPLAANLEALSVDADTEDTPPTAVPGKFRFEFDWTDDEDDDAPVATNAPAPPEDDVAAAVAEAAIAAPVEPAAEAAPTEVVAPPPVAAAPAAAKPVAPAAAPVKRGVPGWVWLLIGVAIGAVAVGVALLQ